MSKLPTTDTKAEPGYSTISQLVQAATPWQAGYVTVAGKDTQAGHGLSFLLAGPRPASLQGLTECFIH